MKFEFKSDEGITCPSRGLAEAHVELGKFAAKHNLKVHVHPGEWSVSCFSCAYKGNDPLMGIRAVVRRQDD